MEWTNDHREWYRKVYLKSAHWRELKRLKLRENPKCQRCQHGVRAQLDVHHINYRNIFDVGLDDLETLCRPCHNSEHAVNGHPKRNKILYENYVPLPSKIKIDLQSLRRKTIKPPKSEMSKISPIPFFDEVLMRLFDGKCFNCGNPLELGKCRKIGKGGKLVNKLIACFMCIDSGKITKITTSDELLNKFQRLSNEIVIERAKRREEWLDKNHFIMRPCSTP